MAIKVTGELREGLLAQTEEIQRQLLQPNGYPFDPAALKEALQQIIDGRCFLPVIEMIVKGMPLQDLVEMGNYGRIHNKEDETLEELEKPMEGERKVSFLPYELEETSNTFQVLQLVKSRNFRTASLTDILTFGAEHLGKDGIDMLFTVIPKGYGPDSFIKFVGMALYIEDGKRICSFATASEISCSNPTWPAGARILCVIESTKRI